MRASPGLAHDHRSSVPAGRSAWMLLIIVSGLGISPFFACVTPFAALATLAALKLDHRDALTAVGLVWLINQVIGYSVLGYPWTWDSIAWGLAIGASTGLAVLAARGLSTKHPVSVAVSLPFVAAFATFELSLYLAGFFLPMSAAAFSASVIWLVFLTNVAALCALGVIYQVAAMIGIVARNMGQDASQLRGLS